jgi:signal transduction histidine kinase
MSVNGGSDPAWDDIGKILARPAIGRAQPASIGLSRERNRRSEQLDLNGSVDSMLGVLRPLIGENIELVWSPYADRCFITIDRSQLEQILTNLCVNARDAIGETGRITIETSRVFPGEAFFTAHAGSASGEYVRLNVSITDAHECETVSHLLTFFTQKSRKGHRAG